MSPETTACQKNRETCRDHSLSKHPRPLSTTYSLEIGFSRNLEEAVSNQVPGILLVSLAQPHPNDRVPGANVQASFYIDTEDSNSDRVGLSPQPYHWTFHLVKIVSATLNSRGITILLVFSAHISIYNSSLYSYFILVQHFTFISQGHVALPGLFYDTFRLKYHKWLLTYSKCHVTFQSWVCFEWLCDFFLCFFFLNNKKFH